MRTLTKTIWSNSRARRRSSRACAPDDPAWVDTIALCELVWALESAYGYARYIVVGVLRQLLGTAELLVDSPDHARAALRAYEGGGAAFANALMGLRNRASGCDTAYTFDRRAARRRHTLS